MNMKKIVLATAALIISFQIFAQFPGAGANGKGNQAPPSIGHVYGKLIDSLGKPIDQASVVILQNKYDSVSKKKKDVLLKGLTTDNKGEFSFEDLPVFGALKLKVSAIGFKADEQTVSFQPGTFDKDLGNIKLQTDVNQLQGVTVTTSASSLQMDIDKKTFNVDKNIVSAGGTAVDVMKNVPSVQVDIEGNVKLRNATPQLYIDGRPTTLSLDQIPADAIQSVEVITNPSAKYDASGGNAGILNIVLKKNKKTGYNGNLMAGVDRRGSINGGGNFSVRQGKINLTAAVMANQRKDRTDGSTDRTYFGDTLTHIFQDNTTKNNGAFVFGRLGLEYFVTNRTTLSLAGVRVHGEFKPNDVSTISTDSISNAGTVSSSSQRTSNSSRIFNAYGLQGGMVHNFAKEGAQLTADGNFFSGKNSGQALYTNNNYDANGNYIGSLTQQQLSNGNNQFLTLQTDYTNPLTKKTKLEAGLRAQINKIENNNELYTSNDGAFTKIPNSSINYHNKNNVYAAYTTVTSSIKDFGYKVGLRAESSNYTGELTSTGQQFSNKYPISLFPSIFLSQKLANKQEIQLNYSRRINRPNFFQLIPYTDRTDSLNITRGNPDLVPEFTNSFEFSYSKTFKKNNSFLASIYYKHTNNLITRFLDTLFNSGLQKTELVSTYVNANSSYSYGAEFTSVNYINKWWDLTANVNIYNSKINTDNVSGASQDAILSWFGKLNNNFKLPSNFSIQLSANYQSKTNLPVSSGGQQFGPPQAQSSSQGYIKPFWSTDIAIKKTFLKNNVAAVTLSVSDIFRTRVNEQISTSPYFYQDYRRLNNPQMVRLNFSYRFGKMDMSLFKRQNRNQGEGTQEATQMGGTR
jgi:outer membrane receptor protein involved in Fe transport